MTSTVTVLIPCFNEELSIFETLKEFSNESFNEMYNVEYIVVDNNSTDKTFDEAENAFKLLGLKGLVISETIVGKGQAVRTGLLNSVGDAVVLVDGDFTYSASNVNEMVSHVLSGDVDMAVGDRLSSGGYSSQNERNFHNFGNLLVAKVVTLIYQTQVRDVLSGLRVFSRAFIETYPCLSQGFELEIDLTMHTLDKRLKLAEYPVIYRARPEGSISKLNTFKDGAKVLSTLFSSIQLYKPLFFFGIISMFFLIVGFITGLFPVLEYLQTGIVTRVPLAILAVGFVLLSGVFTCVALVLNSVAGISRKSFEIAFSQRKSKRN